MPAYKNQHYVPRCYLKAFSSRQDGKTISLYNISTGLLVQHAPIGTQCAKDYFYGDDLKIEHELKDIEGKYASVVKLIMEGGCFSYSDLEFLRDFCYLQYSRTDIASRRIAVAQQEMTDLIFEDTPADQRPFSINQKEVIKETIALYFQTVSKIQDLKVCLVRNTTRHMFITSDDPTALLNRFYMQRVGGQRSAGISNAGAMFVLPISPSLLLYSYDGDVYTCPDSNGHVVNIVKDADVLALNAIQYIKASQNLYFSNWDDRNKVIAEFLEAAKRRPQSWHKLHYAVRDDNPDLPQVERFREVLTKAERQEADEGLVHLETAMLDPGSWFSKVKFRHKPKYIESGANYIRRLN